MKIPAIITQGDTVTWHDSALQDGQGNSISAPDWALSYRFAGPSAGFTVASTASGTGWTTTLTAVQTAALVPGDAPPYLWQAVATYAGQVVTVGSGRLVVRAGLGGAAAGYDGRSEAEKQLAIVRAAITDRINNGGVAEYAIGSRRLRNEPLSELLALESSLKMDIANERRAQSIANGLGDPRNFFVRFA